MQPIGAVLLGPYYGQEDGSRGELQSVKVTESCGKLANRFWIRSLSKESPDD